MSGTRLVAALVSILLLTFVVPPLAARHVNQRRIAAAEAEVGRIAAELASVKPDARGTTVLHGPGEAPKTGPGVTWLTGVSEAPLPALSRPVGPDPWGNRYYAILPAPGSPGTVIVLSAGPNGIVETGIGAFGERALPYPAGDDIITGR